MGSGWHEWPLMIFTVFGQCGAGGFIVLALALLKGDLRAEAQQRVIACMFGVWVLMGIGFIASMLQLGSPMRAFNSLNRVGASALSNEIASGSIFFAVGWVLMGIGFIASMLHLGSPMRAFNSLNRVGASALSNEIASGSIFFAVVGIGLLLAMMKKLSP